MCVCIYVNMCVCVCVLCVEYQSVCVCACLCVSIISCSEVSLPFLWPWLYWRCRATLCVCYICDTCVLLLLSVIRCVHRPSMLPTPQPPPLPDDILRRKGKGTTANQQQKSSSSSSSSGAAAAVSTSSFQGRQGKQAPQQRRPPHKTKPSVEGPLDGLGTHTRKRPSSMVVAAGVKEEEGPSLKVPKKEVLNPLQASLDDLLAAKSKAAKSPFERVKEGERGSKGGKSGAARARMKVEGKYGKQGKHGKQGGRGNGGVHKGGETWGQQQSRPSRQQNRDQSSRSFQRGDQVRSCTLWQRCSSLPHPPS